jgi:hypothetical protein
MKLTIVIVVILFFFWLYMKFNCTGIYANSLAMKKDTETGEKFEVLECVYVGWEYFDLTRSRNSIF